MTFHSVWEVRMHVLAMYYCIGNPSGFCRMSHACRMFWAKLNAVGARGMTDDEWNDPMLDLEARRVLGDVEFAGLLNEAGQLEIRDGTDLYLDDEK